MLYGKGDDVSLLYAISLVSSYKLVSRTESGKGIFLACVINDFELEISHALVQFMLCDENT